MNMISDQPMTLQEAYNLLLKNPSDMIVVTFQEGYANQSFEFVDPPSYTTAAQHGRKVMQEVRVWGLDEQWPRVEEPRNHWGFLYPPEVQS